jgi:hypothetical protein
MHFGEFHNTSPDTYFLIKSVILVLYPVMKEAYCNGNCDNKDNNFIFGHRNITADNGKTSAWGVGTGGVGGGGHDIRPGITSSAGHRYAAFVRPYSRTDAAVLSDNPIRHNAKKRTH